MNRKFIIKDGVIQHHQLNYINLITFFKGLVGEWDIIIKKHTTPRSNQQNRWYRAYLKIISNETGDSTEALHEYFKDEHIEQQYMTVLGREVKAPKSTTNLNTAEWKKFMQSIEIETGIPYPDPNDLII